MKLPKLTLLWKILLSTSIALTVLFGVTGWIVQNNALRAMSNSVDSELEASFRAYDSLWRAQAERLASVSLVLSRMSDVRAAFSTGDEATIRDTAAELWKQISNQDAIFLVTDPSGKVITSLGGSLGAEIGLNLPVVRDASGLFPKQASGFMLNGGRLYQIAVTPVYVQSGSGMGLLNVLVAGYEVDSDVAKQLKDSTGGSDFWFVSKGNVVASTLTASANMDLQAASSSNGELSRVEAAGAEYTMLSKPLSDVGGQTIGELRILHSFEAAQRQITQLRGNIILVWFLAVVVGLLLTYNLAKRILEPVQELDRGAAEVSRGNYDYRLPKSISEDRKHDELGRLAAAFNAMCASIQGNRRELIRHERIATIGRLSTSIVHDLRNPLAAIYGGAEMLMDEELSTQQVQRLAGNIYRSSRRMQELLQELVDTGRGKTTSAEMCRLREVVTAAFEVYAGTADAQCVTVSIDVPEELELPLERARMERVFQNLIDNALGMMPGGGRLNIFAEKSGQSVVVKVEDTGPGIAPQIRSQLFQPFVTMGKKNGVGLGLAFAQQTVLDHGGELWVDPEHRAGARFLIRLPLTAPTATA
ncbi:MAG: ATP-binding protein [Bryobacteraceae bacterium]